jgi:hypothetical protein
LLAIPRRGFLGYLLTCKDIVDAELISDPVPRLSKLVLTLVAVGSWARGLGKRAMVAGMAMAAATAAHMDIGFANSRRDGITDGQGISHGAHQNTAELRSKGYMTTSYTPLHTLRVEMEKWFLEVFVWGLSPRGTEKS